MEGEGQGRECKGKGRDGKTVKGRRGEWRGKERKREGGKKGRKTKRGRKREGERRRKGDGILPQHEVVDLPLLKAENRNGLCGEEQQHFMPTSWRPGERCKLPLPAGSRAEPRPPEELLAFH